MADAQLPALFAFTDRIFGEAEHRFGIRGRLMRRRDDPATYMEVYEGVPDAAGFDAFLAAEGAVLGVERRVERFISAERPA